MKKFAFTAMLALAAGMIAMPVIAADDDGEKMFTVHGEIRSRWERLENLNDLTDTGDDGLFKDAYSFLPYRARVAVHGQFTKNVEGVVELQNFGTFGNDNPTKGFQDPRTQAYEGSNDNSGIDLYQAYIRMNEIGGSSFFIQMGRQELSFGTGLLIGNNEYYNGRSFDGALAGWEAENWDVTGLAMTINERNAQLGSGCPDDSIDDQNACRDDNTNLYGAVANIWIGDNGQVITPYLLYYRDGRGSTGINASGFPGAKFMTLGGRYGKDVTIDDDALIDWNIEAAYQSGDIDPNGLDLSIKAWITEGWIGFNFHGDNSMHRVGGGFLVTSGDDDSDDEDANSFRPLFGDIHANNRLGNIDFGGQGALSGVFGAASAVSELGQDTGITDINLRYNGIFGQHAVLFAYHYLQATTLDEGVNSVVAAGRSKSLGSMIDLGYDFTYSKNLVFATEISFFSPGDYYKEIDAGSDTGEDMATRITVGARLRF